MKRLCKSCGEEFSNVRAFAGHMSSHKRARKCHKIELGFIKHNNQQKVYGVRKSSKKSWWSNNICKQCGREFKNSRALFGHMRCHSKGKGEVLRQVLRLPNNLPKEKRSVRRYKVSTFSANSSWSSLSTTVTTSVSVDDEQELEDIAYCLLMLAKGGFYSASNNVCDYNDDDGSVKMVPEFCVDHALMSEDFGVNVESGHDGDSGNVIRGVSVDVLRCGYVGFTEDVAEFQGIDFGILRPVLENGACGPAFGVEGVSGLYDTEIRGGTVGIIPADSMMRSGLVTNICGLEAEESKDESIGVAHQLLTELSLRVCGPTVDDFRVSDPAVNDSRVSGPAVNDFRVSCPAVNDSWVSDPAVNDCRVSGPAVDDCKVFGAAVDNAAPLKHLCKYCSKSFRSGQVLGGHMLHCGHYKKFRRSETSACVEPKIETDVLLSQKADSGPMECVELGSDDRKKSGRKHMCLVCCKYFPSGQSLGGHMRAHTHGNGQSNKKQIDASTTAPVELEMTNHHALKAIGAVTHTLAALVPVV